MEAKTIFDNDDLETHLIGLYVLRDGYESIRDYINNGKLNAYIDDNKVDSKTWVVTRNIMFGNLFKKYPIGFSSEAPIYFDLFTNKLNIYNPINEKWYAIQMTQETTE